MGTPHHHHHRHHQMVFGHLRPQANAESFTALLDLPPSDAMELLLPSASVPPVEPYVQSLVKDEVITESRCSNPNSSQLQRLAALRGDAAADAGCKRKEADRKVKNGGGFLWFWKPNWDKFCAVRGMTGSCLMNLQGKGSAKKKKKSDCSQDGQVLPYVHVRARRGQATDSHSLAERARREKINARMKFLQELVPGCNKISGTALVLDEIINHVQSLQRQVEVLSMKLAAVNSWIDFDVDSLIYSGLGVMMDGNFVNMPMPATEFQLDGNSEEHYLQWPLDSSHDPILPKEESQSIYTPEVSPLSSNSSAN